MEQHQCNEIDRGKPKTSGKNLSQCHFIHTNPTQTDPGSNPGLRGGRPAANRLSHGTALSQWCHWNFSLTYSFRPHCGPAVDSACNGKDVVLRQVFLPVLRFSAFSIIPLLLHIHRFLSASQTEKQTNHGNF
jgi:hypothetical protein